MALSHFIDHQQRNELRIAAVASYLLALGLHAGIWHIYLHTPKTIPQEEKPQIIEVALVVQPKPVPVPVEQPITPAKLSPPPVVPKPQPVIKPPAPKPLPKPVPKVEKPAPKKIVEKPEKLETPKPRRLRSERPIYTPELAEEPAPPAPEPVRETHHEPPPAPPRHHDSEDEGSESHHSHKAHADKGEDNSYRPGAMSGFRRRYPSVAQERGWEGTVTLKVHISADGDVGEVIVVHSSGHDILDEAAVDMIKDARATPARRGDKPVDSWVVVPYRFTIPK
jgi:protein TonB